MHAITKGLRPIPVKNRIDGIFVFEGAARQKRDTETPMRNIHYENPIRYLSRNYVTPNSRCRGFSNILK